MGKIDFKELFSKISREEVKSLQKLSASESSVVRMLALLGVVELSKDKILPLEPSASNFLLSLAEYASLGLPLISNWKEMGGGNNILDNGFKILKQSEIKRYTKYGSKTPIQNVNIFLVVIKANVEEEKSPVFLTQYNSKTNNFQLIAGYVKPNLQAKSEILRLLKKELPLNDFKVTDLSLEEMLPAVSDLKLSRKTGMLTKFQISAFQVEFGDSRKLKLTSIDSWVRLKDLKSGITKEGVAIFPPFEDKVGLKRLFQRLESAPLSLQLPQPKHVSAIVKHTKVASSEKHGILEKLLSLEESSDLEFKSSARWDYRENIVNKGLEKVILKTVAAFMNSNGGNLIIGVSDTKEILGILNDINTLNKKNVDGYMQFLASLLTDNLGKETVAFIKIKFETSGDRLVCIVEVSSCPTPVFVKNGEEREFYIRSANTTRLLNSEETYKYILSGK